MKVKELIEQLKAMDRDDEDVEILAYIHREEGRNEYGDWAFLDDVDARFIQIDDVHKDDPNESDKVFISIRFCDDPISLAISNKIADRITHLSKILDEMPEGEALFNKWVMASRNQMRKELEFLTKLLGGKE